MACAEEEFAAKSAKLTLVKEIKRTKEQSWKQLCDDVERDSWGKPYKIVMGKLCARTPISGLNLPGRLTAIIKELFPTYPARPPDATGPLPFNPAKQFDIQDIRSACAKLKNGKAPGPDSVTNDIIKVIATH